MSEWIKVRKIPVEVRARGPIQTNEVHNISAGDLNAEEGDFIIDDGDNTYPVKPSIFYKTYQRPENLESKNSWFKVTKKPVQVKAKKVESKQSVQTLEGEVKASVGDYIINGVEDEKYPVKPEVFSENYSIIE